MFTSSSSATPEHSRKPAASMASWFSSLRRQPKNKKATKNLQKSCVDLSTLTPAETKTNVNRINDDENGSNSSRFIAESSNVWTAIGPQTDCQCPTVISKTETIQIDRVKKSIGDDEAKTPETTTTTTTTKNVTRATVTTTKVIQTTVITKQSHRVGLVFNDDGELISKLETFKNFANNLNSQMAYAASGGSAGGFINSRLTNNNNSHSSSCNSNISSGFGASSGGGGSLTSTSGLLTLEDDIEFIDGSSSSSSGGGIGLNSCNNSDIKHKEMINSNNRPKPCALCRNKIKNETKSDWNINNSGKVIFYFVHFICFILLISLISMLKN